MTSALAHPLVVAYLRELDTACTRLPPAAAAELSAQISAHLVDALPPDADDQAVRDALAALGPASLVAADAGRGHGKQQGSLLRRLAGRVRRLPLRSRLTITALVVVIGLPAGMLVFWYAQPTLQADGSYRWWSPVDARCDVTTQAAGATQDTVPLRPGAIQGFALTVVNSSDVTQVILGAVGYQPSPGAPVPPQIAVSTVGPIDLIGDPYAVRYQLGGPIPPHSYRWVRVLWRSDHGYLITGSSQGLSDLLLRVRVGAITRTEDVQLPTDFAVQASRPTSSAARCP